MLDTTTSNVDRHVLAITGMTCGSCARNVERALHRIPGVVHASVDLSASRAMIEGDATVGDLIQAVEDAGYGAQVLPESAATELTPRGAHASGCC